MTYKEFASQINIKVDNLPNDCDMSRDITVEDCIYLFNSLGRQIRYLQERSNWHTGTPPMEQGTYLIRQDCLYAPHIVCERKKDGESLFIEGSNQVIEDGILAYQKIEPYKEKEDGR